MGEEPGPGHRSDIQEQNSHIHINHDIKVMPSNRRSRKGQTLPNIAISYELLHKLGIDAGTLKQRVNDARHRRRTFDINATSPTAAMSINFYYSRWNGAFKNSEDLLEALSSTYTTVGQQWFSQDAQYATQAAQQGALQRHNVWAGEKHAYETWERLSQTHVTSHAWDENGNRYVTTEPLADPTKPPPKPGEEPTSYTYSANGLDHTTSMTYGENGDIASIETKITGPNGLTYSERTTFEANNGSTTVIDHSDGTKITDTVTGNPDGTGTRTITTTDSEGETSTKTYTGTGLSSEKPTWTQTEVPGSGNDPGDTGEPERPPSGSGTARKI